MQIHIGASDSSSTDVYYSTSSGEIASPPHQSDDEVTCYSLATSRPKNRAGRRVFKETRHPVFRGVRKRKGNKWVCEMREPNKKNARIWLGTYPTPEMAARAHDVAALAFRGKSACLNFADSAWKLPIPTSSDAKVIQRVANEAAQMFRPSRSEHQLVALVFVIDSISYEENNEVYINEEEVLDMPWLLDDMAQGLLLSPPPNYFEDGLNKWDNEETEAGQFLLWDY